MTHEEILEIRRGLIARFNRERNGAVVDAIDSRVTKELFSYGVSLPTIKSVVAPYKGKHELALELYKSNIRELKIASFYIDDPAQVRIEQVLLWSETLTTLELVENITFALLSRCENMVVNQIFSIWEKSDNLLLNRNGIKLLELHHERFRAK